MRGRAYDQSLCPLVHAGAAILVVATLSQAPSTEWDGQLIKDQDLSTGWERSQFAWRVTYCLDRGDASAQFLMIRTTPLHAPIKTIKLTHLLPKHNSLRAPHNIAMLQNNPPKPHVTYAKCLPRIGFLV